MFELIGFYVFGVLSLAMFLVVVSTNNMLYALSALASGMLFISSFFFILNADFLGVVQIMVYTGAVGVLYAFAMMFIDSSKEVKQPRSGSIVACFLSFGISLMLVLLFMIPIRVNKQENLTLNFNSNTAMVSDNTLLDIGHVLFSDYIIAFELAGILLLVALIGGIALGVKHNSSLDKVDKGNSDE